MRPVPAIKRSSFGTFLAIALNDFINVLTLFTLFNLPCIVEKGSNRDILPNVLKEAMSMQIPVITSKVSGIEELVENNVNGILVPQKNPLAIADAIEKMLNSPNLMRKIGRAGKQKVIKEFNIKKETKKLEKMFREIVSSNLNI